ncbi:ABC transporter ATP-binding protein [Halostella litorea]|uniref:ABC transporter ATP-binding protein n=1 Tax=Halostella litorea TaxID=2528831 RepID=UPI001092D8D6|nr:ABC transporter ATP-binding protein [Halostella litorea]
MSSEATSPRADDGSDADGSGGADPDGTPAVSVRNLTKVYGDGGSTVRAVDGIDLDVAPGTAVGILGPNGAGKTTAIKSMLGLIEPTDGTVRLSGHDVAANPRAAYRTAGAMLEGARNVYWRLTVRENLRFFAALGGQRPDALADRHDALLEQFGLADKADEAVRDLSRGMKQKTSLAATLARGGDVVFLDEPTLGLDVESSVELRRELRRLVDGEGTTVVLSSHDMDVVQAVCDRVVIMNEGGIVADDTVENLLDLFRTRAYEVTVDDALPEPLRREIRRQFGGEEFRRAGDRERFVTRVTGDEFYDLVDALRAADCTVASWNAVEPDLEDVFLHVTDGDRPTDGATGGDRS